MEGIPADLNETMEPEEVRREESLSDLDLDSSRGVFQALYLLGKIRLKPERPKDDEVQCRQRRHGGADGDRYQFANPVPQPLRKVRMCDLGYTNIEWQMMTLHRSKNPSDEVLFSRYVDLARQRVKSISGDLVEKPYRSSDAFFRSWRLQERWTFYEKDSSSEGETDETYKPSIYRVPLMPYDDEEFVREPDKGKTRGTILNVDSININRIVQRLEKLRTMNPFHYKPPREPKPRVRKSLVRKKEVLVDGKVVVDYERGSSFEEDLGSEHSSSDESTVKQVEPKTPVSKKVVVRDRLAKAARKKRRHLWCEACAAAQKTLLECCPPKK